MVRADLHYAIVLDAELYEASKIDASLLDPLVRVEGGLPGTARPITVIREYQGPQGSYLERVELRDPKGAVIAESPLRRITLSGEMFEDRFESTISGVELRSGDEHTAHFIVGDTEIGSIPVFIEAGLGGDQRVAAEETFKKATQKGAVIWLTVTRRDRKGRETRHDQPVWFTVSDSKVYVLDGETEQHVPGLREASEVTIIARSKDLRSRVSEVPADVRIVPKDDDLWAKVATASLGVRLNLVDGEAAVDRWREHCELVELTPRFREAEPEAPAEAGAPEEAAATEAPAEEAAESKPAKEDIHVEAQIDQEVFDALVAEGKSERVARAKAKAAYVRREKARIRAEQEGAGDAA